MKTEGSFSRAGLYLGTSGWAYGHWHAVFYPAGLPAKDRLKYYARHFPTTEVNYSFYHLPRPVYLPQMVQRNAGRVRFCR